MGIRGDNREDDATKVTVVGLGELGRAVTRALCTREDLRIVALVDDALAGESLRAIDDCPSLPDLKVVRPGPDTLRPGRGGVMLHTGCEGSLADCLPILEAAAKEGIHVVSTCAELAYPFFSQTELAERIDEIFRANEVTCLGVGFHPGFAMDRLPVFLGCVVGPIRHVWVKLRRDLSLAPEGLTRQCGLGMSPREFESRPDEAAMGPRGLVESALLIADGLGIEVGEVEFKVEPSTQGSTPGSSLDAGRVSGLRQEVQIFSDGREVVRLEHELGVGLAAPGVELRIDASPPVHLLMPGPIDEEAAAAWAIVNAASQVVLAEPGLMTVLDLPLSRYVPDEE